MEKIIVTGKSTINKQYISYIKYSTLLNYLVFHGNFDDFYIATVFYNMYKLMQMSNMTISEAIETDMKKGNKELQEGKKVSGAVRMLALPLAIGMGIPMVFIMLIYLWIAI